MKPSPKNFAERMLHHLTWHGIVALGIAVVFLVLLRGLDPRIFLLFGLPPLFAALHTAPQFSPRTRGVAWTFLGALGLGSVIAFESQVFPNLGGVDARLERWQDRMLAWYIAIYINWLAGVLPIHVFVGSLKAKRRGEPTEFSRFTCYLGLSTVPLLWPGLLWVLIRFLGFWPVI